MWHFSVVFHEESYLESNSYLPLVALFVTMMVKFKLYCVPLYLVENRRHSTQLSLTLKITQLDRIFFVPQRII